MSFFDHHGPFGAVTGPQSLRPRHKPRQNRQGTRTSARAVKSKLFLSNSEKNSKYIGKYRTRKISESPGQNSIRVAGSRQYPSCRAEAVFESPDQDRIRVAGPRQHLLQTRARRFGRRSIRMTTHARTHARAHTHSLSHTDLGGVQSGRRLDGQEVRRRAPPCE